MIDFSCPHCRTMLKAQGALAGRRIRCPRCQHVQDVPPPSSGPAAAAPRSAAPGPRSGPAAAAAPDRTALFSDDTETREARADRPAAREVLKGRFAYEVEGEVARGGMGAIMRAVDPDIRREVAVKFLLNQASDRLTARFVEEAQITGQLEHPNIVPIHQLGVHEDGRRFFSMKLVKGRSLADILKAQAGANGSPEFTLVRLLNIFSAICNALGYAHARDVIHRDLKPANVMVGDFGEVYVMDWGLAKVLGQEAGDDGSEAGDSSPPSAELPGKVTTSQAGDASLTQAGLIMGTPAYMPPEQATGEVTDRRSDIYSLGAILYELLTLSPPVGRADDFREVVRRVVDGAIPPPEQQAPERARRGLIPAELSAVALKALARDPADRYQSVEALQRDVQRYLEGRSVSAKHDTAWEMFTKLVKRNKGASLATAAALVVLTGVVAVAFRVNYRERLKAEEARARAEDHYQAYLREQQDKSARTKQSAPAFLRAAQLMTNEKHFDDALAQVTVALDYDPEQTAGWLLKGQLLIGLGRYAEAAGPLQEYVRRGPEDPLARKLAELASRPRPDQPAYLWSLWEVFDKQQALPLAGRMTQLAERFAGPTKELLANYRKRIEAVPGWSGKSRGLTLDRNGTLGLSFLNQKDIRDLSPLKGMQLSRLDLYGTSVRDLAPLHGMPLTWLELHNCSDIQDLEPLRGMPLTWLGLQGLSQVKTLEPLRGMRLKFLSIAFCHNLTDLEPLRGMPLTELSCGSYGGMKLRSLEPLTGMKLKKLDLMQARLIQDLGPLRGMPLESLAMRDLFEVRDFEPLRDRPLASLDLTGSRIRDLGVLKGMPLTRLVLGGCPNVTDLTPLAGLPLTELYLQGTPVRDLIPLAKMKLSKLHLTNCKKVENFEVLKGLPLTDLNLTGCQQLRDLEPVRGLKVQHLHFAGCNQIDDLAPLTGMALRSIGLTPRFIKKGLEIVRGMKSLDTVSVDGRGDFPAAEFWKRYDAGGFK